MPDGDGLDIVRGNILIRHTLNLPIPDDEDQWGRLVAEAMWLEGFRARLVAEPVTETLIALLGSKKKPKKVRQ